MLYIIQTDYVIEKSKVAVDKLSIQYNNEQVDNLMVSKIALVNRGNVTIDSSDIPIASPLLINVKDDCKILSAIVIEQSNTSSLVNVTVKTPLSVNVKFDYLDKRDGAVIQVIHTGNHRQLNFTGKLKGGRIVMPANDEDSKRANFYKELAYLLVNPYGKTALFFLLILTLVIVVLGWYSTFQNFNTTIPINGKLNNLMKLLVISMPILLSTSMIFASVSEKPFIPKRFRKYFK